MADFQSLDRAIDILFSFTKEEMFLPAEEIARRVGLPRVSVYRYLNTLVKRGLLEKNEENGKYGLGYKLLYFQSIIHYNNDLEKIAFPVMTQISKSFKETVHLTAYKDGKGIIIESIESSAPVRVAPPVGHDLQANGGSTIEAIIAFLPEEELKKIDENDFVKYTPETILDLDSYLAKLKKIRENGYAFSSEEVHPGAWGVAAPVFNNEGFPIASLGISGPLFRLTDSLKSEVIESVLKYSKEVTDRYNILKTNIIV